MLQLMGQKPKSTRFPLKEKALLKDSPPPLKSQKSSAPGKYTTSEFSRPQ